MKRLTEKDYCGYDIKDRQNFNGYDDEKDCQKIFSCLQKLGKHEDIEEKLGIDLITLFKALKQGYIETRVCKLTNIVLAYDEYIKKWCFYEIDEGGYGKCWLLKDYGKTWALTKEELE